MMTKNPFKLCLCYAALIMLLMGGFSFLRAYAATEESPNTNQKPYIVTTTAHIADLVQNIVQDKADVKALIGTGLDPHLYRPLRSDMIELQKADLVIFNGKNLEGRMQERLLKMQAPGKPVIALADSLNIETHDPHIWMDPDLWIEAATILTPQLTKLMPEHSEAFEQNSKNYIHELKMLDNDIKALISHIPPEKRVLITAHDAFGYFGTAYDIEVVGVQGLSTASEAGLKQIEALVNLCVSRKIPAIFAESSVSDKNIKAIIEGVQSKGLDIKLGGTLYSDSLGATGTDQVTYIGMMQHNAKTIASTLADQIANQ